METTRVVGLGLSCDLSSRRVTLLPYNYSRITIFRKTLERVNWFELSESLKNRR